MKTNAKFEVGRQALILQLGSIYHDWGESPIGGQRQQRPGSDDVDVLVGQIVAAVGDDVAVKRMLGIGHRLDAGRVRLRLAIMAYLALNTLRQGVSRCDICDLANNIADPRLPPPEALLWGRHEIGTLIHEAVLIGGSDKERPAFTCVSLPVRTLVWLSGGADSWGYPTFQRMSRKKLSDDCERDEDKSTDATKPVPSARALFLAAKQRVHGCDPQLKTMCSRISLAACRAEMLARGVQDTGVGNQVLLVFGASGTGKTYAVEEIARASNLIFSSFDGSGLSGLGWSGSSVEDAMKVALGAANGDSKRASNSIICYDEIDKVLKAGLHEHRQSVQSDLLRPLGGHSLIIGGKRNYDCPPTAFDCAPTTFVLSGVFEGLAELMGKKGRRAIGFHSVEGEKSHNDFRRALAEYGCIEEVCGRISCCVRMPEPQADTIAQWVVSEHGVVEGFNRVLAARDIVIFPQESAVNLLGEYGVSTRTFYRGVRHLIGTVIEEILFDGNKGSVMLDAALIRRAIDRAGGGVQSDAPSSVGVVEPILGGETDGLPEQAAGG